MAGHNIIRNMLYTPVINIDIKAKNNAMSLTKKPTIREKILSTRAFIFSSSEESLKLVVVICFHGLNIVLNKIGTENMLATLVSLALRP